MRISYLFLPVFFTFSVITFSTHAQHSRQAFDKWQIGVNPGIFVYQGDLTSDKTGSFKTMMPGITVTAAKPLGIIALKGAFTLATLKGDDYKYRADQAYRAFRQFKFETGLAELSAQANIYFHNERRKSWRFNPYLSAGIGGVYFFNNKMNTSQTQFPYFSNADLINRVGHDVNQGMPSVVFTVPVGAGFNFRLSDRIIINLEGIQRLMNTDYLDGFSISANPDKRDQFFSLSAGVHFVLGKKEKNAKAGMQNEIISGNGPEKPVAQQVVHDTVYIQVAQRVKTDTVYRRMNDRDMDGIADSIDICPDVAGRIEYRGCTEALSGNTPSLMPGNIISIPPQAENKPDVNIYSLAMRDIYFDYDRVSLNREAYTILYEIVRMLKEDNTLKVIFKGHTDLDGSDEYNNLLSWRRAAICSDFLQSYNIGKSRISTEALGKQQPVVKQLSDTNRQWKNRRVEAIVYREK